MTSKKLSELVKYLILEVVVPLALYGILFCYYLFNKAPNYSFAGYFGSGDMFAIVVALFLSSFVYYFGKKIDFRPMAYIHLGIAVVITLIYCILKLSFMNNTVDAGATESYLPNIGFWASCFILASTAVLTMVLWMCRVHYLRESK